MHNKDSNFTGSSSFGWLILVICQQRFYLTFFNNFYFFLIKTRF